MTRVTRSVRSRLRAWYAAGCVVGLCAIPRAAKAMQGVAKALDEQKKTFGSGDMFDGVTDKVLGPNSELCSLSGVLLRVAAVVCVIYFAKHLLNAARGEHGAWKTAALWLVFACLILGLPTILRNWLGMRTMIGAEGCMES